MASNFACTPTTKLRRDTEILGVFAPRFQFTSSVGHAPPKAVTFKSSTTSVNSQASAPKKAQEKNFGAFHKKQGVALLRDDEGRREARSQVERLRQKDKRTQKIMEKRKIERRSPTPELLLPTTTSRNANLRKAVPSQSKYPVPLANNNGIGSSRKDQLQRWKEQKTAAEEVSRKKITINRAPVIAYPAVKQAPGQGVPNKNARNVNAAPARKPPIAYNSAPNINPASKPAERRVTRAMAKVQIPSNTVTTVQPAINKMKELSLNTKTRKGVGSVPEARAQTTKIIGNEAGEPSVSTNTRQSKVKVKSEPVEDVIMTAVPESNSIELQATFKTSPPPIAPIIAPPAPAAPKKKIMGLDPYYVEYNQYLAEACTTLMKNWTLWENKRENDKLIPEDVLSEIESTLGQANLLMNSKLPQFIQLLYFYLTKENFTGPSPVLPCDLQGWWDVASIQVEKVTERFNDLSKREQNGWRPPMESCPRSPLVKKEKIIKPMKNSTSKSDSSIESTVQASTKPKKPKSTQASSGLRQFLAKQRKNAVQVDTNQEADAKNANKVQISSPRSSAPPDKTSSLLATPTKNNLSSIRQFEGGFFQVTSPLRNTNTNASAFRTPVQPVRAHGTASRRASTGHNSSLVTLAVRKSMGPMFKIGATPQLTAEESADTKMISDINSGSEQMEVYPSCYPKPTPSNAIASSDLYGSVQGENQTFRDDCDCDSGVNAAICCSTGGDRNCMSNCVTVSEAEGGTNCINTNHHQDLSCTGLNENYKNFDQVETNTHPPSSCHSKHGPYFVSTSFTTRDSLPASVRPPPLCKTSQLELNGDEIDSDSEGCRMINLYSHGRKQSNSKCVNSSTSSDTNNSACVSPASLRKGQRCARQVGADSKASSFESQQDRDMQDFSFQNEQQIPLKQVHQHSPNNQHHSHSHRSHHSTKHHRHSVLKLKSKSKCTFSRSFHFMDVITQGDHNHDQQAHQRAGLAHPEMERKSSPLPEVLPAKIRHRKKIAYENRPHLPDSTASPIFRNFNNYYALTSPRISNNNNNYNNFLAENIPLASPPIENLPKRYNNTLNVLNPITRPNRRKRNNPGVIGEGRYGHGGASTVSDELGSSRGSPQNHFNSNEDFVDNKSECKYENLCSYSCYKHENNLRQSQYYANDKGHNYVYDKCQQLYVSQEDHCFNSNSNALSQQPFQNRIFHYETTEDPSTEAELSSAGYYPVPEYPDSNPPAEETSPESSWSPFCYSQLNTFNSSELRAELESIFCDWPKEFVVMDEDEELSAECQSNEQHEEIRRANDADVLNSQNNTHCPRYISFLKGDITVGPVNYCDIFGAQNLMDLHPEYSPFSDSTNIVQNLIFSHHQQQEQAEGATPYETNSCSRKETLKQPMNCPSYDTRSNLQSSNMYCNNYNFNRCGSNSNSSKGDTELKWQYHNNQAEEEQRKELQNKWNLESNSNNFGTRSCHNSSNCNNSPTDYDWHGEVEVKTTCSSTTTGTGPNVKKNEEADGNSWVAEENCIPQDFQCQVCDIYETMKRRRKGCNYAGSGSGFSVNISAECTNCGRFTDITPRGSSRFSPKLPGGASEQPMVGVQCSSRESGSDGD